MADALPKLPSQISPDGREIWDWAENFSRHVHRIDEVRKTKAEISEIGNRCGDCANWMKSRSCPHERNVNGRNHGPSCAGRICQSFVLDHFAAMRRDELSAKLSKLEAAQ